MPALQKSGQTFDSRRRQGLVAFAGVFVLVGVMIVIHTFGAGTPLGFEAETGTLAGGATAASATGQSGTGVVKFGAGSGFVHPGILVNKTQLDFVKNKIATGQQPWTGELTKAQNAKTQGGANNGVLLSSPSYVPHPTDWIMCGDAKQGCEDETTDSQAAYTNALLWYYTGNTAYAKQAIKIMNAWSAVMQGHRMSTTDPTIIGGVLNAAWAGETWPKAAEIIRYTYTPAAGTTPFDVTNMERMLRNAYLPDVINGWSGAGANWLTSMQEATIGIGVFLNDRAVFNNGIGDWRGNVKAMIYMAGDVNQWPQLAGAPYSPPGTQYDRATTTLAQMKTYWHSPSSYISGLETETCRDLNHTSMGFGGLINAAETARIQGVDLYGEEKARVMKGIELNTGFLNQAQAGVTSPPGWVCPAAPILNGGERVTYAMAYNHYVTRLSGSMPNTNKWLTDVVLPGSYRVDNVDQFEVLTSWGTP